MMASRKTFQLTGVEDVDKALREMEFKLAGKAVRKATRAGAKVFAARVKELAPVDTGLLEESIKVRSLPRKMTRRGAIGHSIQAGATQASEGLPFYARFIEFGTEKMARDPFVRPAFVDAEPIARKVVIKTLRRELGL